MNQIPMPDGLRMVSTAHAEKAWCNLAPSEGLFHTKYPPFETMSRYVSSFMKKNVPLAPYPLCTHEMLCTLAYFGERMICGNSRADHRAYENELILSPGPCTFFMSISPSSDNELMRYMLTAFELAIRDKDYLGAYIIRRTNALHSKTPCHSSDTNFHLLSQMIEYEYEKACAAGHAQAAWKLYAYNMMLYALSIM